MSDIISVLNNKGGSIKEFVESVRQGIPSATFGVTESFKCLLIATLSDQVLLIVKDGITAEKYKREIESLSDKKVVVIPSTDFRLVMSRGFSKEITYKRLCAFSEIPSADVVIVTPEVLMQKVPEKTGKAEFIKGKEYLREELISDLVSLGYVRGESAENKGSFSIKGDVLEIFPINFEDPLHIDFFGDTIEDIKIFDADTHKSQGFIDKATVVCACETVFSERDYYVLPKLCEEEIKKAEGKAKERLRLLTDDLIFAVDSHDNDSLSFAFGISENAVFISELLDKNAVVIFDEGKRLKDLSELCETEYAGRYNSLVGCGETFSFVKKDRFSFSQAVENLKSFRFASFSAISSCDGIFNPLKIINCSVSKISDYRLNVKEAFNDIKNWLKTGYTVYVFCGDEKRQSLFYEELLKNEKDASKNESALHVTKDYLPEGFIYHESKTVFIGTENLYSKGSVAKKRTVSKKQAFFTAPEAGDYAVHEVHGVGRVLGNKRITTSEGTKDYIAVEYAGNDVLYVPVEQLDVLSRYLGSEKNPKLSKIGGRDFERVLSRVKESIRKMSFDLKKLYEERRASVGFKYRADRELQNLFEESFEYEETEDQLSAIDEITFDMTEGRVMDRLVCGDVGFGKTEVAFRAVFLAVSNGKQCAMLAPTTILTEQHYITATERFKDFGIRTAVINRFRTPKEQQSILKDLSEGKIDFIIGTHRLLGKDVAFKDLGLLILDEEQRFGVEHKEKIKLLKKNVDTLTLTATPIPRTLHMSLSGIREISVINTPPKKRLPVQTYVTEETDVLITDAVTREINRGGQAFILYNRVETIYNFAEKIKALMPDIRITVAHGQMEERKLEKNVMEFYNGKTDVLISTTIIENGIDLPKANTLIVIDADRLGLSTLYQLKGRVGRSDRLAYAYFTYKRDKILTGNAYERLSAIVDFAEMGSGIKIAMRDLEIRGAGNVLGAEQHGHMDKIGYELYSKLLKEEINGEEHTVPELDVKVSAFIPESYIPGNSARMSVYKEIAEISSEKEMKETFDSIYESFGSVPTEVKNLIKIAYVKMLAEKFSVKKLVVSKEETCLTFVSLSAFKNEGLLNALESFKKNAVIDLSESPKIRFLRTVETNEEMLDTIKKFLKLALV